MTKLQSWGQALLLASAVVACALSGYAFQASLQHRPKPCFDSANVVESSGAIT